ncbi:MAG: VOC family protein [Lachnospiraceae bacterium]|nr:VOC family protein [Lachnospiraceae bacterium]
MDIRSYLGDPIQIGLIVRSFDELKEDYEKILGLTNFRLGEFPPKTGEDPKRIYHGKSGDFSGKFYFYQWNNIEIELIEPVDGESIWKDYLSDGKKCGIHHIKFAVERLEPLDEYFATLGITVRSREQQLVRTRERLGFTMRPWIVWASILKCLIRSSTDGGRKDAVYKQRNVR